MGLLMGVLSLLQIQVCLCMLFSTMMNGLDCDRTFFFLICLYYLECLETKALGLSFFLRAGTSYAKPGPCVFDSFLCEMIN